MRVERSSKIMMEEKGPRGEQEEEGEGVGDENDKEECGVEDSEWICNRNARSIEFELYVEFWEYVRDVLSNTDSEWNINGNGVCAEYRREKWSV